MRGDGRIFQRKGTSRWWIAFSANGREYRESAGKSPAEARKLLRQRLREIQGDRFVGPTEKRLTVDDLLDALLTHLETRGAKSLVQIRAHLRPIRAYFGQDRAVDISSTRIEKYTAARLALGKARATVNRELQPLKQAFTLAVRQGRLAKAPYIPLLREDNAREGFFEQNEFNAVVRHLPKPIDDVARFAYFSGWRKGEILSLRWSAVDRKGREIRLRTSKSGHGRLLPLEGELWAIIARRWKGRGFRRPSDGMSGISEFVFHRQGKSIGEFRKSWATACKEAGVPGKLFHDLRRTAVRNMVRAGVPQSVAMAISGHRTISMFLRYNITSDEDRRKAVQKMQNQLR
jgi:integrase